MLLAAEVAGGLAQVILLPLIVPSLASIISSTVFAFAYTYATFSQMRSERRLQRGGLQKRLTAIILAVTIPVFIAVIALVFNRANGLYKQSVIINLSAKLNYSCTGLPQARQMTPRGC